MRQHLGMCISLRQPEGRSLNAIVYLSTPPPRRLTLEKKLGQKKYKNTSRPSRWRRLTRIQKRSHTICEKGRVVYVPRASAAAMFDLLLKRR